MFCWYAKEKKRLQLSASIEWDAKNYTGLPSDTCQRLCFAWRHCFSGEKMSSTMAGRPWTKKRRMSWSRLGASSSWRLHWQALLVVKYHLRVSRCKARTQTCRGCCRTSSLQKRVRWRYKQICFAVLWLLFAAVLLHVCYLATRLLHTCALLEHHIEGDTCLREPVKDMSACQFKTWMPGFLWPSIASWWGPTSTTQASGKTA